MTQSLRRSPSTAAKKHQKPNLPFAVFHSFPINRCEKASPKNLCHQTFEVPIPSFQKHQKDHPDDFSFPNSLPI